MHANIQEKQDNLIKKRKDLLQQLAPLSGEVLSFKAAQDNWSIIEVIEHLVMVEEDFFNQLSTNVPASMLDPESRTPEKYQTVINIMKRDIPVDVPDESVKPHGHLTLDELLSQWDEVRNNLIGSLDDLTSENRDDLIYRHPYGGPLNIAEALNFIDVHFDNHRRQIDRILAESNVE